MTDKDKELLELAAKAAGIKALRSPDGVLRDCTGGDPMMNIFASKPWNPLTDDGDALRLAVKLKIQITPETYQDYEVTAYRGGFCEATEKATMGYSIEEATRRAIVRAAAEIGRNMK